MQQLLLICQDMFNDIRSMIREDEPSCIGCDGFIDIAFFPFEEAGSSYRFSCALDPDRDVNTHVTSCTEAFVVKRRILIGKNSDEETDACVYTLKDCFKVVVKIGGLGEDSKKIHSSAKKAIEQFLAVHNPTMVVVSS